MNKVLVTGGAGYVGRELVRQLVHEGGNDIHILDNLSYGEHRLAPLDLRTSKVHRIDIRDVDAVSGLLRELAPQTIYHLAAMHYIPACEAAPAQAASVNVVGTVNLLNALPEKSRFVFASSAAVYKPAEQPYAEAEENVGPVDVYGLTKLHGEHYVRHFHERGKVDGVIVRLFNVVGPGETNPHLVPAIIAQIGRGEHRVELGNLFPRRDYIDVSDAAEGFRRLAAVTHTGNGPIVSNLGTGKSHAVREVVEQLGIAAGVNLEITQDPLRIRANDRPMLCASTATLEALTGWCPQTGIATSLAAAWGARIADEFT